MSAVPQYWICSLLNLALVPFYNWNKWACPPTPFSPKTLGGPYFMLVQKVFRARNKGYDPALSKHSRFRIFSIPVGWLFGSVLELWSCTGVARVHSQPLCGKVFSYALHLLQLCVIKWDSLNFMTCDAWNFNDPFFKFDGILHPSERVNHEQKN